METERMSAEVRDGVRGGILASIKRDVELRGGRTARLLLAAGVVGVFGAIGVTLLVAGHPYDHHPPWHLAVFSTVWAGLLFVSAAVAFLQVRTPSMPLARSALVGMLGLGLAGLCGALCPDQHFLHWWSASQLGEALTRVGGLTLSALCFGIMTTLCFGAIAAFALLRDRGATRVGPLLPAVALALLLAPGVALQAVDAPGVFPFWMGGTAVGAYLGIAFGIRVRSLVPDASTR